MPARSARLASMAPNAVQGSRGYRDAKKLLFEELGPPVTLVSALNSNRQGGPNDGFIVSHGFDRCHAKAPSCSVFSRFAVRQGVKWTPLRTVFAAILMGWEDAGQLGQRFARVCEYLQAMYPRVPGDLLQRLVGGIASMVDSNPSGSLRPTETGSATHCRIVLEVPGLGALGCRRQPLGMSPYRSERTGVGVCGKGSHHAAVDAYHNLSRRYGLALGLPGGTGYGVGTSPTGHLTEHAS